MGHRCDLNRRLTRARSLSAFPNRNPNLNLNRFPALLSLAPSTISAYDTVTKQARARSETLRCSSKELEIAPAGPEFARLIFLVFDVRCHDNMHAARVKVGLSECLLRHERHETWRVAPHRRGFRVGVLSRLRPRRRPRSADESTRGCNQLRFSIGLYVHPRDILHEGGREMSKGKEKTNGSSQRGTAVAERPMGRSEGQQAARQQAGVPAHGAWRPDPVSMMGRPAQELDRAFEAASASAAI